MAPEIPGFYFDEEKKKYFKIVNGSTQQTTRYHNNTVQYEKRRAENDSLTGSMKDLELQQKKKPKPNNTGKGNKKNGKSTTEKTLTSFQQRLKHAMVIQSKKAIAQRTFPSDIDITAMRLDVSGKTSNNNNFTLLMKYGFRFIREMEPPNEKYAACTNVVWFPFDATHEVVLLEFGFQSLTYHTHETLGTGTDIVTSSHLDHSWTYSEIGLPSTKALVEFVNSLENDDGTKVFIENQTTAFGFLHTNTEIQVTRAVTVFFHSSRCGSRSIVLFDCFKIDIAGNVHGYEDLTRRVRYGFEEREDLFGYSMLANPIEAIEDEPPPGSFGYDLAPVAFKVPSGYQKKASYVTASYASANEFYFGTNNGELVQASLTFLFSVSYNVLKIFDDPVSVVVGHISGRLLCADGKGNMCIIDQNAEFNSRETYATHGTKITNFLVFQNYFVAVGLKKIGVYSFKGELIHIIPYANGNITNQVSLNFSIKYLTESGSHNYDYILVNETNEDLLMISLPTFSITRLNLASKANEGYRLVNMMASPHSRTLKVFYEKGGKGVERIYQLFL